MRVLAVLDREDIVAAAKFLLCRADAVALYEQDLMTTFKAQHWTLGVRLGALFLRRAHAEPAPCGGGVSLSRPSRAHH